MSYEEAPRKPRGARRWSWATAVTALLVVAYVGGYAVARSAGRVWQFDVSLDIGPYGIGDPLAEECEAMIVAPDRSLGWTFRPCIVVEEWWRNR